MGVCIRNNCHLPHHASLRGYCIIEILLSPLFDRTCTIISIDTLTIGTLIHAKQLPGKSRFLLAGRGPTPSATNLAGVMEPKRLSKLEIVRRLFRKYSTSDLSEEQKLSALRRIMTKLSTSVLSPAEIKEALIQLIKKLK